MDSLKITYERTGDEDSETEVTVVDSLSPHPVRFTIHRGWSRLGGAGWVLSGESGESHKTRYSLVRELMSRYRRTGSVRWTWRGLERA
jgi:hypothetical protein